MKLIGKLMKGGTSFDLAADTKRVARFTALRDGRAVKLSVYADGGGSGVGPQVMRGVIYDSGGTLLALGDEVTVEDGQAGSWVDLMFTGYPGGVPLAAGSAYDFGVLGGQHTRTIRVYGDDPGSGALTGALPLTVTGNEITDATRAAAAALGTSASGQMADGRLADSTVGIYRAATNLFRHGQMDALTDWNIFGSGTTRALDATVKPPFSSQSIKYTTGGTAAGDGAEAACGGGQAAAGSTPGVGSVWFKGVAGASYTVNLRWYYTDATASDGTATTFNATGAWQLLTPAMREVNIGKTGDTLAIHVRTATQRTESFWLAHPMLEKGVQFAAPYVATTGGVTATHGASRPQAPATLLAAGQSYVAIRFQWGWPSSLNALINGGLQAIFLLSDGSTNNYVFGYYNSGVYGLSSQKAGSAFDAAESALIGFAQDEWVTLVFAWTETTVSLSVNGGNFITVARAGGLPIGLTTFDIGTLLGANWLNSHVAWMFGGAGVPSNADAAAAYALGSTDPSWAQLPAQPTFLWTADNTSYIESLSGRWGVDTYLDGASNPFGAFTPLDYDLSIFASYTSAWVSRDRPEEEVARLPWEETQRIFGLTGGIAATGRTATLGWYGSDFADVRGSFALVQQNGPLAGLVGDRIVISRGTRSVYVYVVGTAALNEGEDLAVPQRVYAALDLLTNVPTAVDLEVLA